MIDNPQVLQTAAQPAAVIHITVPRDRIHEVMGPGFGDLMAALTGQGITPAGPPFSHHLRMDPETFDFEMGMPVASSFTATGRVVPGVLPAARVARTVYHGDFEGLGGAWGELDAWIAANGHAPAPDLWETYLAGPESSADPADWRTELNRPLIA